VPNKANPTPKGKKEEKMRISVKLKGENPELVERLREKGVSARLVKGGVVVYLPEKEGKYEVLPETEGGVFHIDVEETGGGTTNTGDANIVASPNGGALRPYRRGGYCGGPHAYFAIPDKVATVKAERNREGTVIFIEEHKIAREGNIARIVSSELWRGMAEELPELFSHFKDAVEAALQKASCYHCREPHFISGKD